MGPEREEGHYAGGLLVSRRMVEALVGWKGISVLTRITKPDAQVSDQ